MNSKYNFGQAMDVNGVVPMVHGRRMKCHAIAIRAEHIVGMSFKHPQSREIG